VARLRAEGVTCGLGLPGEREREEEADRAGLGRAAGPAQKVGPRGGRWVWAGKLGFAFSISILFLFLIQTKVEFKYKFEFKPHSNKSMHQHECNTKFKPMIKF